MKRNRSLGVSIALISLLVIGLNSTSQAQTKPATSSQIASLQKQINTLQSELKASIGLLQFSQMQLEDRITTLQSNQLGNSYHTTTINYAVAGNGLTDCGGSQGLSRTVASFSNPYFVIGMCSLNILVP